MSTRYLWRGLCWAIGVFSLYVLALGLAYKITG